MTKPKAARVDSPSAEINKDSAISATDRQNIHFGYGAVAFGVVFVITLLALAVIFPEPTNYQQDIFRIVLALAAAGIGAMLPGALSISFAPLPNAAIQAGGAIALFVIVYFFNPASRIAGGPELDAVVPDVTYLDKNAAVSLLSSAGLTWSIICENAPEETDETTVYLTDPPPSKRVESGSKVILYVNPPC